MNIEKKWRSEVEIKRISEDIGDIKIIRLRIRRKEKKRMMIVKKVDKKNKKIWIVEERIIK